MGKSGSRAPCSPGQGHRAQHARSSSPSLPSLSHIQPPDHLQQEGTWLSQAGAGMSGIPQRQTAQGIQQQRSFINLLLEMGGGQLSPCRVKSAQLPVPQHRRQMPKRDRPRRRDRPQNPGAEGSLEYTELPINWTLLIQRVGKQLRGKAAFKNKSGLPRCLEPF